jgi:hypothetical protein
VLRRYWFTFRDPPASGYSFGCGVTAFDYGDAIQLLREKVFDGDVPEIDTVQEDVDVSTLNLGVRHRSSASASVKRRVLQV